MAKQTERYNLRQVVELTGISEFTLRAWELRYASVQPQRTDTGRRLYNREQVIRISSLMELVRRGHRIGKIANLPQKELQRLLDSSSLTGHGEDAPQLDLIMGHISRFDWPQVQKVFREELKKKKPKKFIFEFLLLLIQEVNLGVAQGSISIAQEHIVSALIKESLHSIRALAKPAKVKSMRLVLATPEGDWHELGLLIAATLASLMQVDNLFIGANSPKLELADTCLRYRASHLILVSTIDKRDGAQEDLLSYLNYLDRQAPQSMKVWLGGRNSQNLHLKMSRGFQILGSLAEFQAKLEAEVKSKKG